MVDIIIGGVLPAGSSGPSSPPKAGSIEAVLLNVRNPRQRITKPKGRERRQQFRRDPAGSKVLTILVPRGATLPKDLDGRKYKILLRFQKK
jgi:hypothetical protein